MTPETLSRVRAAQTLDDLQAAKDSSPKQLPISNKKL
jgi:hypothetical protein